MTARRRLAILCAGQGEQAALDFAHLRPAAASEAATQALWQSASALVGSDWAEAWSGLDPAARQRNRNAQLAVVLHQALTWLQVRAALPVPDWVLGYSVGELSAHAIAGSLDWTDLPRLASRRAAAMDAVYTAAGPCLVRVGGPLPPGASARRTAALKALGLEPAIVRSAAESVWGGPPEAVAALLADPAAPGWHLRAIDVRCPSHTSGMASAQAAWAAALAECPLQAPRIGVLAGISAQPVRSAAEVSRILVRQIAEPIVWDDCLAALPEHGVTEVLDLGPGQDLQRLLAARSPEIRILDLRDLLRPP